MKVTNATNLSPKCQAKNYTWSNQHKKLWNQNRRAMENKKATNEAHVMKLFYMGQQK